MVLIQFFCTLLSIVMISKIISQTIVSVISSIVIERVIFVARYPVVFPPLHEWCNLKNQVFYFILIWVGSCKKIWIHASFKGISSKWNTNSLVKDLNSTHWPLGWGEGLKYADWFPCRWVKLFPRKEGILGMTRKCIRWWVWGIPS